MPTSRPLSFRRLLVFWLLLLGIPILLVGQYFTLRKARTGLLETARQNLASSALRKAEFLQQSSHQGVSQVQMLAQMQVLKTGSLADIETALTQLTTENSLSETCFQLTDQQIAAVVLSTCQTTSSLPETTFPWPVDATAEEQHRFTLVDLGSRHRCPVPKMMASVPPR